MEMDRRPPPPAELDEVISAVASAKKYHTLSLDTIRRVAGRELAIYGGVKAATRATRRRLHQIYGAFDREMDYEAAYRRLEAACGAGSDEEIRAVCRELLSRHSSTAERLPILDRFYPAIWEVTGRPTTLLDLGCGLNPLALPWMSLLPDTRYIALDIAADRVHFLNRYLALAGLQPLARCQDLLVHPPDDAADVALLLKMSPSLERQEKGATLRLMEQLRAPFIVVSFAVKSLGGRQKGMVEHYRQQFLGWAAARQWSVEQLLFETELVFIVKHRA